MFYVVYALFLKFFMICKRGHLRNKKIQYVQEHDVHSSSLRENGEIVIITEHIHNIWEWKRLSATSYQADISWFHNYRIKPEELFYS